MSLECGTCRKKVNVVTNNEYVTDNGVIFCDWGCKNRKRLPQGSLKRTGPLSKRKKEKKIPVYECPHCEKKTTFLGFNKVCNSCITKGLSPQEHNLRLKPVKN